MYFFQIFHTYNNILLVTNPTERTHRILIKQYLSFSFYICHHLPIAYNQQLIKNFMADNPYKNPHRIKPQITLIDLITQDY